MGMTRLVSLLFLGSSLFKYPLDQLVEFIALPCSLGIHPLVKLTFLYPDDSPGTPDPKMWDGVEGVYQEISDGSL